MGFCAATGIGAVAFFLKAINEVALSAINVAIAMSVIFFILCVCFVFDNANVCSIESCFNHTNV
jgi:hypothetical protein